MAVGEAACASVHAATHLGANSVLDIVVFGRACAMQNTAAVFRTQKTLEEDCQLISKAQESFHDVQLSDRSLIWNSDLIETIELGKLLINVCITMYSAEARKEVRGAQARADFTTRDDVHWMQHATVGTWFSVQIQERISPIAYHLQLPDIH
jgi:succinate dehydrogenase (ubiquinone) flavoprotein subunit